MFFKSFTSKIKQSSLLLIIITICYMIAIIFLFISKNAGFPGETGSLINNILHVPIFFILIFLYLMCLNSLNLLSVRISYLCALFLAIIFSLLIEYFQSHMFYRTASFIDLFFNFIGIILALMIYKKYYYYFQKY